MSIPTSWRSMFPVNTTTTATQLEPAITSLPNGRFVAVWFDASQTGGDIDASAIRGQVFNADGSKRGEEFLVNATTQGGQRQPSIEALPDGRFVVVWNDQGQNAGDTSADAIRGQIFNADATKSGSEFLVNTTTTSTQSFPTVTTLPDGRFVVTWTDQSQAQGDTSVTAVRGQIFTFTGAKQGGEFVVNTTTTGAQFGPQITTLPNGSFVVAWMDLSQTGGDTSSFAIRGQVFDNDGDKLGNEFLVNTTTAGAQTDHAITALSNDRFVVTWTDDSHTGGDTSGNAIRGQVFNADGSKFGGEFLVNTTTAGSQILPDITALPDGRFVTVWLDLSGTLGSPDSTVIRGQVFDANGGKHGSEFTVATAAGNAEIDTTIDVLPDGRFVVAWSDVDQPGTNTGLDISAQIFDPRTAPIRLSGTDGDDDYVGSRFADTLRGGLGNDHLRGEDGSDLIAGGGGNDTIDGGAGYDELHGGAGRDRINGGADNDELYGDGGSDTLQGDAGNDELFGGAGNDSLEGGAGDDELYGGTGADTIVGGLGNDEMNGDDGADTFVFAPGDGRDTISSLDADDRLDLTAWGFTSIAQVYSAYDSDGGVIFLDFSNSILIEDGELLPEQIIIGPNPDSIL